MGVSLAFDVELGGEGFGADDIAHDAARFPCCAEPQDVKGASRQPGVLVQRQDPQIDIWQCSHLNQPSQLAAHDVGVLRLIRVAVGPLPLGELAKGAWRHLDAAEVQALAAASS